MKRTNGLSGAFLCTVAFLVLVVASILSAPPVPAEEPGSPSGGEAAQIPDSHILYLPEPAKTSVVSVERAIATRRSIREFSDEPVTLHQLSQLLWAAQGITGEDGLKRAAPSAGAKYPMEIYIATGRVKWAPPGVYHYRPEAHRLELVKEGDVRSALHDEALSQEWVKDAPLVIIITAVYERTMEKYGERGIRYVHMEVGAVGENVYLQAGSLGLGTTFVGAFSDEGVKAVLGVSDVAPLGIMPVGAPR